MPQEQLFLVIDPTPCFRNASQYLKACMTFEQMNAQAAKISDNEAALALNNARKKLFKDISALIRKQA